MTRTTTAGYSYGQIAMKNTINEQDVAAAELALKAYVFVSNPEILVEMPNGDRIMQEMASMVDLTQAPEDAVSSLVADLLQYCKRENINWNQDVMSRASAQFRPKPGKKIQKR